VLETALAVAIFFVVASAGSITPDTSGSSSLRS
jgi:hypothetical protein